jgi:hypothetical protein
VKDKSPLEEDTIFGPYVGHLIFSEKEASESGTAWQVTMTQMAWQVTLVTVTQNLLIAGLIQIDITQLRVI